MIYASEITGKMMSLVKKSRFNRSGFLAFLDIEDSQSFQEIPKKVTFVLEI